MFYMGIVEDNADPKKMGRLKIRIFGIHTENRNKAVDDVSKHIPTNDLPWAYPNMPITNSSIDGVGDFSTIVRGTKVLCCFIDQEKQHPICLGVLPSIVTELPDFELGFSDPSQEHPKEDYLNESSISRLARNEKIDDTIVDIKKENVEEFEVCGQTIKEPETEYDAKYPNNRVIETASGHIIEIDDTEGKERLHFYHKMGTFLEIFPDGRMVSKINGARYDIVLGKDNVYIASDKNVRIDGKCNIEIVEEAKVIFNAKATVTAKKELNIEGEDKIIIKSTGDVTLDSSGNTIIKSTGNVKLESSGLLEIKCNTYTLDATGTVTMTGSIIALN